MPQEVYYRYFWHPNEIAQLHRERMIRTTNPTNSYRTYFTPARFSDPTAAQQLLALDYVPQYRVGPIQADVMPGFDVNGRQIIQPAGGQPGGGIEVCTTHPVYIFGCNNFATRDWKPL